MAVVSLCREVRGLPHNKRNSYLLLPAQYYLILIKFMGGDSREHILVVNFNIKGNYVKSHGLWSWANNARH